jgi:aspartyl protease family protein
LGLLIHFFGRWEAKHYNPNRSPESQSDHMSHTVILQRNRYHHYVTDGTINQQAVTFLLDTGASDVVIPADIAKQLQLPKGQKKWANTANGIITVYHTQLDTLTIGSITLKQVTASINPSMHGKSILLGMSALKNIAFTQRGDQLTLQQFR